MVAINKNKEGLVITDRINVLRKSLNELVGRDTVNRTDRRSIRNVIRQAADEFAWRAYMQLRRNTTVFIEDDEIFKWREEGWAKYGKQEYIVEQSPVVAKRHWGMTIHEGWLYPQIDFIGSNRNTINVNVRFSNLAPHANKVLLGEYGVDSWDIPKGNMHGGRKVMMWQGPDGQPRFRWVHTKNGNKPPIHFKKPATNTYPIYAAEREIESSRSEILDAVEEAIKNNLGNLRYM